MNNKNNSTVLNAMSFVKKKGSSTQTLTTQAESQVQLQVIDRIPSFRTLHKVLNTESSIQSTDRKERLDSIRFSQRMLSIPADEYAPTKKQKTIWVVRMGFILLLCSLTISGAYFFMQHDDGNNKNSSNLFRNNQIDKKGSELKMGLPLNLINVALNPKESTRYIPVILDFPGISNNFVSEMLDQCLGLKGMSVDKFNTITNQKNFDFLYTSSTCDFSHVNEQNMNFRLISFIQNPVHIVYNKIIKFTYDNNINNLMTKSILCNYGNLTNGDFIKASKFFKNYIHAQKGCSLSDTNKLLHEIFNQRLQVVRDSVEINNCMKKYFSRGVIENHIDIDDENCIAIMEQIVDTNLFDVSLYSNLVENVK